MAILWICGSRFLPRDPIKHDHSSGITGSVGTIIIYHEWSDMLQYMDKNVKIYHISGNIIMFRNGLVNLSTDIMLRNSLVNLSADIILRNGLVNLSADIMLRTVSRICQKISFSGTVSRICQQISCSGKVSRICLNIPAWMSLMSGDQEADWQVYRIQEFKPIKGGFRILLPLLLTYSRQVPA